MKDEKRNTLDLLHNPLKVRNYNIRNQIKSQTKPFPSVTIAISNNFKPFNSLQLHFHLKHAHWIVGDFSFYLPCLMDSFGVFSLVTLIRM